MRLTNQEFDAVGLVHNVVAEVEAALTGKEGISLEAVTPESVALVSGDEDRLRQVLLNLIDNALKYSPDGGRVEIAPEPSDGGLRIAVRDARVSGFRHAEQQRIFGKFYRVDSQQTLGVGGTGLGL